MAKDTIELIKSAEHNAGEVILQSKEESKKIIDDATEQKKALIKDATKQLSLSNDEFEQQAQKEAENIKTAKMSALSETLENLDKNYNAKKSEAIEKIINTVLA